MTQAFLRNSREDDAASARLVISRGAEHCAQKSSRVSEFAIGVKLTTTRRRQGGRADAVSWGACSPFGRGLVGHEPAINSRISCVAAIPWATRARRSNQAVAADEVPAAVDAGAAALRELLVAHASVVPEHAAVGSDGQVRHVGLDRLHSISDTDANKNYY